MSIRELIEKEAGEKIHVEPGMYTWGHGRNLNEAVRAVARGMMNGCFELTEYSVHKTEDAIAIERTAGARIERHRSEIWEVTIYIIGVEGRCPFGGQK